MYDTLSHFLFVSLVLLVRLRRPASCRFVSFRFCLFGTFSTLSSLYYTICTLPALTGVILPPFSSPKVLGLACWDRRGYRFAWEFALPAPRCHRNNKNNEHGFAHILYRCALIALFDRLTPCPHRGRNWRKCWQKKALDTFIALSIHQAVQCLMSRMYEICKLEVFLEQAVSQVTKLQF